MDQENLGKLVDDIKAHGLLDPIVLYHDQILDGRNRHEACRRAGIEPRFAVVNGEIASPTIYVLSKNLHRRHLSVSRRAAIAADALPLLHEEGRKRASMNLQQNQPLTPKASDDAIGRSSERIAREMGVSRRTVERASVVREKAPEAFDAVKRGETTINGAYDQVMRTVTKRQDILANTQKDRMISALSMINGACRVVTELDFDKLLTVCSADEIGTWAEKARQEANVLRAFAAKFKGDKR
jgi:hypothetical protein